MPRNILYFDRFVEELFETKTLDEAFKMIDEATAFLSDLEGKRLQGGPAENKFKSLFDVEEVTNVVEVDLENPEDEKLRALESDVDKT